MTRALFNLNFIRDAAFINPEAHIHCTLHTSFSCKDRIGLCPFYCIAYKYEPRSFPLETDAEGNITEAFTPDFYLPEQDRYIELTTMKQSLVTRKNRKVRKLRRLYPDVNIRIFYQRDFYQLMAKYGILADNAAETLKQA